MASKFDRKLINNFPRKTKSEIPYLVYLLCFPSLLVAPESRFGGLSLRGWSTAVQRINKSQWLFVRHPYGDLYLLFVRESEDFIGFLCNS